MQKLSLKVSWKLCAKNRICKLSPTHNLITDSESTETVEQFSYVKCCMILNIVERVQHYPPNSTPIFLYTYPHPLTHYLLSQHKEFLCVCAQPHSSIENDIRWVRLNSFDNSTKVISHWLHRVKFCYLVKRRRSQRIARGQTRPALTKTVH